jgi:hypothetical protein
MMQPEELERWQAAKSTDDDTARVQALYAWHGENIVQTPDDDRSHPDSTALVDVDRTMRRLGLIPANPAIPTYE